MVTNEIHSLLAEQGASALLVDDLQAADLTELAWSGDAAHLRSIQTKLLAVARGAADYLAVRAPDGSPLAIGLIDYAIGENAAEIGQLAVQPQLQGMGLGTHLIARAEVGSVLAAGNGPLWGWRQTRSAHAPSTNAWGTSCMIASRIPGWLMMVRAARASTRPKCCCCGNPSLPEQGLPLRRRILASGPRPLPSMFLHQQRPAPSYR